MYTLIVVYGVSLLFPKNITKEKKLIDILLEEIAPLSSKRVACKTTLSIHSFTHSPINFNDVFFLYKL